MITVNLPVEKKSIHIMQLDGLRGVAVLLVSLGHIFYQFYPFKAGWIGLNLFFTLSGYLITYRLYYHLQTNAGTYFKNFYGRRFLRIFPLYYGCLLFFFVIAPLLYPNYEKYFSSVYREQGWYWFYMSNWRLFFWGLPANPVFFHFWSLAVEEQFYVFWPILFRCFSNLNLKIVMAVIITASIVERILTPVSDQAYYNTLTICEPLLLGAGLYILQKEGKLAGWNKCFPVLLVLSFSVLAFVFYHNSDLHISNRWLMQYGYSAIDLIWISLMGMTLLTGRASNFLIRVFSIKWLRWLGKYSYGIYVYHWLILQLFVYKYESEMIKKGISLDDAYWVSRILGILGILVCSYLSYNLYEKHFLRLKRYFNS